HSRSRPLAEGLDVIAARRTTAPSRSLILTPEPRRPLRLRRAGGGRGGGKIWALFLESECLSSILAALRTWKQDPDWWAVSRLLTGRAPSPTKRKDRSDEKSKDRSKDKGATKESSEKDRGRDKTRKRRSASSGSSSTRSRSSSTSSSGSSTSTGSSSGSSSSSASSRSGSSSTSRSSSSSSSSGSPSPSRRRHDNRRRSRSKSKPPKRDEKERKRRSPSPKPTKVHIGRLTRNVTKDHIMEIFSTYGKIKMIDMPVERMHPHLSKGYAYVEFENPDEAEKALKHMDGGQIDGQEITATAVLAPWPRPPPRRFSPPRRMLPPLPMWRRSPPRMRRRWVALGFHRGLIRTSFPLLTK
uniref:RNA-binding protein with serine-rich domain 1 n=1 Tax=Bos indicus x Bos taurus TaxID=30522 RepID=A0A4W2F8R7_BOBOX